LEAAGIELVFDGNNPVGIRKNGGIDGAGRLG
jgi:hypothetical protein